ncbi:hypothetical protein [Streptomyces sp. NPDC048196]|uniref:hypothetical protein n=1 Tax=Streptomyces sp. NPDC048196 TaxID=3154712 RepID=UPI0033FC9BA2
MQKIVERRRAGRVGQRADVPTCRHADVPNVHADVPTLNTDVPTLNTDVPTLNAAVPNVIAVQHVNT